MIRHLSILAFYAEHKQLIMLKIYSWNTAWHQ